MTEIKMYFDTNRKEDDNFQQDYVLVSYNKLQEMCYYGK